VRKAPDLSQGLPKKKKKKKAKVGKKTQGWSGLLFLVMI
jgi:hypothetical protein